MKSDPEEPARQLRLLALFYRTGPKESAEYLETDQGRELAESVLLRPAWSGLAWALGENPLEVAEDFANLFHEPNPRLVTPYASHWTDLPGGDNGLGRLKQLYLDHDFSASMLAAYPDHISIMLDFPAHLLAADKLEAAHDFGRLYLAPWLPRFCRRLEQQAATPLYRELAYHTLQATDWSFRPPEKSSHPRSAKPLSNTLQVSI